MARWWCLVVAVTVCSVVGCGNTASESASDDPSNSEVVSQLDLSTEAGLYAAAQAAEQRGSGAEAIELYRRILREYPESPDCYKAQFLIGFVFSEELAMPDSARSAFEIVLRDYSESEFADDAEAMIKFLDGELPDFEVSPAP